MRKYFHLLFVAILTLACEEDEADLPSFEDRVTQSVEALRSDLVAPTNGWRLEYQPTPDAGTFLMLMTFLPNGDVNIKSDVPDNNGEFFDRTITYRIDNALGLELILETYGVFHYLFEIDQATFGAEFEFLYKNKDGDNLIFESISDFSNPTQLVFTSAGADDEAEFSRELAQNLEQYKLANPQVFGNIPPTQQLILQDRNISVFWTIDLDKRNLIAEYAGIGVTRDEVTANNRVTINHFTKFTYANGSIVLADPFSFALGGQQVNISQVPLTTFSLTGPDLCVATANNVQPLYQGQSSSLGSLSLVNSLLSNRGIGFVPTVYSVNAQFVFDADGNSLLEEGSIGQLLPEASGFIFFYGVPLNDPNIPIYSVGFIMENGEIYVREYQPTTTDINLVKITLLDQFYYSATPPAGTEQALIDITNELFSGGEIFAFDLPVDGATVFRMFNPCNKYEFFLVQ